MSEDTKPYQMSLFDFAPGGVDSTNLFVHAVMDAVPKKEETADVKAATEKPAKKLGRIEDFGAKIGGARKDVYAAYRDMMQMAIEKDVASMPLSKSWPAPNYGRLLASGMEPWKVHAVRALRDALPPKPGIHHFALGQWANRMSILRDIAVSVLDGTLDEEGLRQELLDFCGGRLSEDGGFKNGRQIWVEKVMDLRMAYEILGHEHSLSKMKLIERSETAEPDPNRRIELVETSGKYGYYEILHAPTKREAWETYRGMQEKRTGQHTEKTTKNPFGVYRWKGHEEYFIGRKLGKTWIEVASPFASSKEAFEYMASHLGELHEKYAELRQTPFERESQNAPRIGTARREGDVTPEQFADTFGFRGVEFGNWVENRKRQDDLNQAYDALMDLAKTLNLPHKVMSLSGSLSLAFGARGRGGKQAPSAHYEPARVVINLTKQSGAGSLAHEWLHAVDNYFARRSGGSPISMMTVGKGITCTRQELREAFQYLHKSVNGTEFHKRSLKLDKRRKDTYWSQPEEMAARAFEAYIKDKLKEQGIRNDYLVNVREKSSWDGATDHSSGMEDTYPYPYGEEMKAIRESFDKLFAVIEYREHEGSLEVYSARGENISQMLADAKEVSPEEITDEERSLQVFSREVLDIDLKFFQGAQELHGRYDKDGDIFYVNRNAEVSMDWVFWHEAFHAMKEHEPELYHDFLRHTEKTEMFTKEQMDGYRKSVQRPSMSDGEVMEELLADAFADSKIGRRTWQHMAAKNPTFVRRLTAYVQKILRSAQRFFQHGHESSQQEQEGYPSVRLTNGQFRDFSLRMVENICSLCDIQGNPIFMSQGYRILAADGKKLSGNSTKLPKCRHSPFQYAPQKQKIFDQWAVRELLQHYTKASVQKALSELSPLGQQTVQYGKRMVQEIGHNER